MMKSLSTILLALILLSCNTQEKEPKPESFEIEPVVTKVTEKPIPKIEMLEKAAYRIQGSNFLTSVKLDSTIASLVFTADYQAYKRFNPKTTLSAKEFEAYWSSGHAKEKVLAGSGARLLSKLPFLETVVTNLDNQQVTVTREKLLKYINKSNAELQSNFSKSFEDEFIYTDNLRVHFIKVFRTK